MPKPQASHSGDDNSEHNLHASSSCEVQPGAAFPACPGACAASLQLLEPRWLALRGCKQALTDRAWKAVAVYVPSKGSCHQGAAICIEAAGNLVTAGFVTTAVERRDSPKQVAGVACVDAELLASGGAAHVLNPYAVDCLRHAVLSEASCDQA